jgi:isomerase DpgB
MAMYRLARLAPNAAAVRRAVMFGTPLAIGDALALHLVHEVTDDPSRAVAEATALAAAVPGTELALRRRLMSDALTSSFEDAVGVHLAACDRALRQASARAER